MGFILLKKVDIAVLTLQGGEGGGQCQRVDPWLVLVQKPVE